MLAVFFHTFLGLNLNDIGKYSTVTDTVDIAMKKNRIKFSFIGFIFLLHQKLFKELKSAKIYL